MVHTVSPEEWTGCESQSVVFKASQEDSEESKEFYDCKWFFECHDSKTKLTTSQEELVALLVSKKHSFIVKPKPVEPLPESAISQVTQEKSQDRSPKE